MVWTQDWHRFLTPVACSHVTSSWLKLLETFPFDVFFFFFSPFFLVSCWRSKPAQLKVNDLSHADWPSKSYTDDCCQEGEYCWAHTDADHEMWTLWLEKTSQGNLGPGTCFSKVPKLFGRISGDIILFVSSKLRCLEARNFAAIFIFILFTTYEKTSFTE